MERKGQTIGRHVYQNLKSLPNPSKQDQDKIKLYEESKKLTREQSRFVKDYENKLKQPPPSRTIKPTFEMLYASFLESFQATQGKPFIEDENSVAALKTLVYYFTEDRRFFNSPILSEITEPSLEKGLLIIGSFGCGKTAMMQAMCDALKKFRYANFKMYNSHQVVEVFEACTDQHQRSAFWWKMAMKSMCFDDLKSEREASNFGKANLFQQIIESRYFKNLLTHGTCNYDPEHPDNLDKAIEEFGKQYGPRVYDRIFEMLTVIEFKGKSRRK